MAILRASLTELKTEANQLVKTAKYNLYLRRDAIRQQVRADVYKEMKDAGQKTPSTEDVSTRMDAQTIRASLLHDFHEAFYEKLQ